MKNAGTLTCDVETLKGKLELPAKDIIDPSAQGNQLVTDAKEKRTAEEFAEHLTEKQDASFVYKIVSNNAIVKFMVSIKPDVKFNFDADEVRFGFNLHIESVRGSKTVAFSTPIKVNTGLMKINKSGGNVSSAASSISLKKGEQEEKLRQGKAQMLDSSYISAATAKGKLDESFRSVATNQTHMT